MNTALVRLIPCALLVSCFSAATARAQTAEDDVPGAAYPPPPVAPVFVAPPPPAAVHTPDAASSAPDRHFALLLGITPSVAVDLDYGLFYGFAAVSVVFPVVSSGEWIPATIGAGVNFQVARDPRWKFEIFGHYSPLRFDRDWSHGVGLGVGIHFTSQKGFTVGFKVPFFGYAVSSDGHDPGEHVAVYYLAAAVSLPLVSFGYRF